MLQFREHRIEYASRSDEFHLWHITDTHLGSRAVDEKALRRDIAEIEADPFAIWTFGGDWAEFISPTDKRFEPAEVANWITVADLADIAKVQCDYGVKLFKPIAAKCLGAIGGNHGLRIAQEHHRDPHADICGKLDIPNLGYDGAFINLRFKRLAGGSTRTYRIALLHGWGGGRQPGGKMNKLRDALAAYDADIILLGHLHVRYRLSAMTYTCTKSRVVVKKRVAVLGGTYLDGAGYALRAGYPPAEIGGVMISITPDKNVISVAL